MKCVIGLMKVKASNESEGIVKLSAKRPSIGNTQMLRIPPEPRPRSFENLRRSLGPDFRWLTY